MCENLPEGLDGNWLRREHLGGAEIVDKRGRPFSETMYCAQIAAAYQRVGAALSIVIAPTTYTAQRYDADRTSPPFYMTKIRHRPVIEVTGWRFRWGNSPHAQSIPDSWIHLRGDGTGGDVEIQDDGVTPLQSVVGLIYRAGLGVSWRTRRPSIIELDYRSGFDEIPAGIKDLIGIQASLSIFLAGGRALAQGLSSRTVGQDGLNQSYSFAGGGAGVYGTDIKTLRELYAERLVELRGVYAGVPIAGL